MTHFEPIDLLTTDYRLQRQGLRHESSGPVPGTAGCCFYHKESLKEIVPRVNQQKQMSSLRELRRPAEPDQRRVCLHIFTRERQAEACLLQGMSDIFIKMRTKIPNNYGSKRLKKGSRWCDCCLYGTRYHKWDIVTSSEQQ